MQKNIFVPTGTIEPNELIDRVRNIPLLKQRSGKDVLPYEDSEITLEEVDVDSSLPLAKYVLSGNLHIQRRIFGDLSVFGHDIFNLEGGVYFSSPVDENHTAIPPVIEISNNEEPLILDGIHRVYNARFFGLTTIHAITIRGVREDCPLFCLPATWEEVATYTETPEAHLKRNYDNTISDPYSLYRNLGTLNGSAPRVSQ